MMLFGFLGTTEVIIILVIALLVFGPQKLPEIGKQIGSLYQELNKMRGDVQKALDFDQYTRFDQPSHDAYRGDSHSYSYEVPQTDVHDTTPAQIDGAVSGTMGAEAGESGIEAHAADVIAPPGPRGTIATPAPFAAHTREEFDSVETTEISRSTDKDAQGV